MPSSQRQDPLPAFRFVVEKEGKAIPQVTRVTGLMLESGLFFPDTPGASLLPVPHVVVQRGVTDDTQLWDWVKMTRKDPTLRYDIRILLMDASGKAFNVWRLVKAYPFGGTGRISSLTRVRWRSRCSNSGMNGSIGNFLTGRRSETEPVMYRIPEAGLK